MNNPFDNLVKPLKRSSRSKPYKNREKWTEEERIRLIYLVKLYGDNWDTIVKFFPNRSKSQCREKWLYDNPYVNKSKLTEKEYVLLSNLLNKYGTRWKLISSFFFGRSPQHLKNSWNNYLTKQRIIQQNMKIIGKSTIPREDVMLLLSISNS